MDGHKVPHGGLVLFELARAAGAHLGRERVTVNLNRNDLAGEGGVLLEGSRTDGRAKGTPRSRRARGGRNGVGVS